MAIVTRCIGALLLIVCSVIYVQAKPLFAYDRAIAAGNTGDLQRAEQLLASALVDAPDSASCLYDAGVIAYKKGDVDHAAVYFKQAAQLSEHGDTALNEQALFNLGNSYVKQQKLEEALDRYKELLRLNHDNERAKKNKEVVEELLKKKEENEKEQQEQQQNNQQQKDQKNQKQQPGDSGQNNNQNSDKDKSNDQSQQQQQSGGQNKQNDQKQDQGQDQNHEQDDVGHDEQNGSDEQQPDQNNGTDNAADQQSDEQHQDGSQQPEHGNDDQKQAEQPNNPQNNNQEQKQQEQKGAPAQAQEQKRNKGLQPLDAALAEIVEKQDKQDAQLNKQLVKILIDNQQPKRSRNGNAPRW